MAEAFVSSVAATDFAKAVELIKATKDKLKAAIFFLLLLNIFMPPVLLFLSFKNFYNT